MTGGDSVVVKNSANPECDFGLADICFRKRVLRAGIRGGHAK